MKICTLEDPKIIVDEFCQNQVFRFSYEGMMLYAKLSKIKIYAFVKTPESETLYPKYTSFHGAYSQYNPVYFPQNFVDFDNEINSVFSYKHTSKYVSPVDENVIRVVEKLRGDAGRDGAELRVYQKHVDGNYYCKLPSP